MDISSTQAVEYFDRLGALKAFVESKAGVKGLVDAGVVEIPRIFIRPPDELAEELKCSRSHLKIPAIDLTGIDGGGDRCKEIVNEIRNASEKWGFFQVVNHGVPVTLLNDMIDGVRNFHEQDLEVKKELYSYDQIKQVRYDSNFDLFRSRAANWRDTLTINMMVSDHVDPDEVPAVCREAAIKYIKHITKLGETLFELLSEALGLKPDHLNALECARGRTFVCHYYPGCPNPELTLGTGKHSDPAFLTILLQDHIGGLQVLHENQWADVQPIEGGLIVNVGDLLQIISNDKFKSVDHRVLANREGPRISVACFLTGVAVPANVYGPIKDLLSEQSPAVYNEFTVSDYASKFFSRPIDKCAIDLFKL
ncbi:hypothetical protein LguiA_001215 [Lonicera macranthoides]